MAAIQNTGLATVFKGGVRVAVQSLTGASTGTLVKNHGLTTITHSSGTDKIFRLGAPKAGVLKHIVINSASTGVVSVRSASTAITLYPTTSAGLVATTGSKTYVTLVGMNSTRWAVASKSTGLTFGL